MNNWKAKNAWRGRVKLRLDCAPESVYGFFELENNSVILDAWKLRELVDRMVLGAK